MVEVDGLEHQFDAPGFHAIRKRFRNISQPVVLKSAYALLNVAITGHSHAVFSNVEAARTTFPFVPKALYELGNFEATDVAGACFESVINVVEIRPHERVADFIQRMQVDQNNLTAHSSAPWLEILKALSPEDASIMPLISRTQIFNWVPGMGTTGTNPNQNLEMVMIAARSDIGMAVNAGIGGPEGSTVFLHFRGTFVDEEREKTREIAHQLEKITRWITKEENWLAEVGKFVECLH